MMPLHGNSADLSSLRSFPNTPDDCIDLRGTPCPLNFVRTKLRLERMPAGTLLEVWLDPGEPIEQVPDSLIIEGYGIEKILDQETYFAIQVRKPVASV